MHCERLLHHLLKGGGLGMRQDEGTKKQVGGLMLLGFVSCCCYKRHTPCARSCVLSREVDTGGCGQRVVGGLAKNSLRKQPECRMGPTIGDTSKRETAQFMYFIIVFFENWANLHMTLIL
jgi:hypothetical protein